MNNPPYPACLGYTWRYDKETRWWTHRSRKLSDFPSCHSIVGPAAVGPSGEELYYRPNDVWQATADEVLTTSVSIDFWIEMGFYRG